MSDKKVCLKHKKVQRKYWPHKDEYRYTYDACDWCERLRSGKVSDEALERGEKVWTVVTREQHNTPFDDNFNEVKKTYPGFDWKPAGCFMDTQGFGTYMTKDEQIKAGLYQDRSHVYDDWDE